MSQEQEELEPVTEPDSEAPATAVAEAEEPVEQEAPSPQIIPFDEPATVEASRMYSPEEFASVSPSYWATYRQIKLQNGIFSLKDHQYQQEFMNSKARRRCFMKATQAGITESMILACLHSMIYGNTPLGCLYLFPTSDSVGDFSKNRWGPLIAANQRAIGRFVRDTDAFNLKKVGRAFLFLRGARLSQRIEGDEYESDKLRGISADRCVFDESDLMPSESVAKARGRMRHSTVQEEVFLSNPTIPGHGIDLMFQQSDQRYWFRKCQACRKETCAELSFPQCVKLYVQGEARLNAFKGYIACSHCGKPLPIYPGHWVATVPANSDVMHGYRWSQLTSAYNDPAEILDNFNDPPEGNLADIYRLRLGLPYVAKEDQLHTNDVLACCGDYLPFTRHPGPCAMGVDVGKTMHVVIGVLVGNERYEIVRTAKVSDWSDVHDLADRYNVRSSVIDIRPYEDSARAFQKGEPYPIYLCEYSEHQSTGPQFNANTGVVKVNRTEIFDRTHRMVVTTGMLKIPRICDETKEFAHQMCQTAKVPKKDERSGSVFFRYQPVGDCQDHFRNAMNYFTLAASGGKIGQFQSERDTSRPKRAINKFRVGIRM